MLIINADDWGRSVAETDAAFECYRIQRITSVSAMVFMADSSRAAQLAKDNNLDVGLHLNFSEQFTGNTLPGRLVECHKRVTTYLNASIYAQILYNPFLRRQFAYSCEAQLDEFRRLYEKPPSHVDGHHHMHLCANLLLSKSIPAGTKMRCGFSFWPGERSLFNRTYRGLVDRWCARRYRLPDYFFDLTKSIIEGKKLARVAHLAKSSNVEVMTHPMKVSECEFLRSDEFGETLRPLRIGGYALL